MANMSYCRFQNTYNDLLDCYHNLEGSLSGSEKKYREFLVELCQTIVDEYQPVEDEEEGEEEDQ